MSIGGLKNESNVLFPFVLILEASVGPIFVKYVFNLLAILPLSVIVSPSTLN